VYGSEYLPAARGLGRRWAICCDCLYAMTINQANDRELEGVIDFKVITPHARESQIDRESRLATGVC
jgi:hypothetical protein